MDFATTLTALVGKFQHPESIFYWPYVLTCYAITLAVLVLSLGKSPRAALAEVFAPHVWLKRSAFTDFVVAAVYMLVFNAPTGAIQGAIFYKSYTFAHGAIPTAPFMAGVALPVWAEALLAAAVMILCFDFATYVGHWLMHKVPFLWDIHSVHHSPEALNMFSAYRQHPFDRLIRNGLGGAFCGVGMAAFHAVLPQGTFSATIMGLGAAFFLFMLTVHLQHQHIPVHYPKWLAAVALSPHLHQIHHSSAERHRDKNFGGIFPYWDKMFGTLHDERVALGDLRFGLAGHDPFRHSILRCYWYPLYAMARRVIGRPLAP